MRRSFFCLVPALLAALVACSSTSHDGDSDIDIGALEENQAKIVGEPISPTSTVEGRFDPRIRVYGYLVSARAGAKIKAKLEAQAGLDARRDGSGPLDTTLLASGPYASRQQPGPRLAKSEDGETVAAPPVSFTPSRDGNYLVAFTANEDTGTGNYRLSLECDGTDFQCSRPAANRRCTPGQLFVQGSRIEGEVTWDKCEVVLLESVEVVQGATLTIKPGVIVKGNYIGQGGFGSVRLTVSGLLQAAGTKDNPVVFTSLNDDRGWGGITIQSTGSSLSNVVIEKANVGVHVRTGGVDVSDSLIQGVTLQGARPEAGIRAGATVDAKFKRAVVKGFQNGLHLDNAQRLVIEDSVVRENMNGVFVIGVGGAQTSCGGASPPPTFRDPVILHSDIVDNERVGVLIHGNDVLVQISKSNIVGNKQFGVDIMGSLLSPQSFFRESNVYDNGNPGATNVELRTFHGVGTIDISKNYWKEISDPGLSANWQRVCNGAVTFTGFSPTLIEDAGPHKEQLVDRVKEHCYKHVTR